jgi:acetoin utilization protein AcuC
MLPNVYDYGMRKHSKVQRGLPMKTAFLYTEKYFAHDYGASHPLKIERLRLTCDLCKAYDLFSLPDTGLIETRPASESEILRFHTPEYVEVLKKASSGRITADFPYGLGPGDNPVFRGLWEWSRLHTGASLQCAELVSGSMARIAFNIAGGLHHAGARQASGFCYVNDPVLVIYHFVDKGKRVLYLDIDAHHGDGVQWAFYEDPRVLTVSFHQDGRTLFPGTGGLSEIGRGEGLGYAVNIPMLPGTDDHIFWDGFKSAVPMLVELFNPDVVVSQLGVDTFLDDPLAALELTTNGFCRAIAYLTKQRFPWVALGGGGYNPSNVARAWTLAWAIMNGVDLPDDLPESMLKPLCTRGRRGQKLRDPEHQSPWQEKCRRHMQECLEYLETKVFPKIK